MLLLLVLLGWRREGQRGSACFTVGRHTSDLKGARIMEEKVNALHTSCTPVWS